MVSQLFINLVSNNDVSQRDGNFITLKNRHWRGWDSALLHVLSRCIRVAVHLRVTREIIIIFMSVLMCFDMVGLRFDRHHPRYPLYFSPYVKVSRKWVREIFKFIGCPLSSNSRSCRSKRVP